MIIVIIGKGPSANFVIVNDRNAQTANLEYSSNDCQQGGRLQVIASQKRSALKQ
jgi:hypothetical protein